MLAKPVKSERRLELQSRNEFLKISLLNISLGGGRSILLSYRDISAVPHINGTAFYYYIHFILFRQGELLYSSMKLILP